MNKYFYKELVLNWNNQNASNKITNKSLSCDDAGSILWETFNQLVQMAGRTISMALIFSDNKKIFLECCFAYVTIKVIKKKKRALR